MNCSEAERLFDAYLDGELTGSLRFEFDAHRLHCPLCQRKLAMMEACEHILVGEGRGPSLSDGFADRVMAQVALRGEQIRRRRHLKLFVGAAIGLQAAAAVGFFFVWNYGQDRDVPPPKFDITKYVKIDPAETDIAYGDRNAVKMIELMYGAVERVQSDGRVLPRYATNFVVPPELAEKGPLNLFHLLGGAEDEAPEPAPPPTTNDPLKL